MTLKNLNKAPFPWFGGKSQAASAVWALLGDVDHYVEPFAGSLAVLLGRPHPANRPDVCPSMPNRNRSWRSSAPNRQKWRQHE